MNQQEALLQAIQILSKTMGPTVEDNMSTEEWRKLQHASAFIKYMDIKAVSIDDLENETVFDSRMNWIKGHVTSEVMLTYSGLIASRFVPDMLELAQSGERPEKIFSGVLAMAAALWSDGFLTGVGWEDEDA